MDNRIPNSPSRRRFLKASALAGTLGTAPAVFSSPAISSDVDVVVAGGGPAGYGAATAAARAGATTLLLERHAFCGGVGAWGLGMVMNQMRPLRQPRGELHELLIGHLLALGNEAMMSKEHALACNVEYLKVAILDVLDSVGCKYLLHTRVVDALTEGNRVAGVVISTKTGLVKIRAKSVVDCTGDCDVAFFAGAETMKGREEDGFLSPMTLNLLVINVDIPRAQASLRKIGGTKAIIEKGRAKYPLLPATFSLATIPLKNAFNINHAGTKLHGVLDATDPEQITEAERYCRRQALQIVAALRESGGPGFEHVQLAAAGPQIGVRETRRVKGTYVLTEEDAKSGRQFEDTIGWRSGFLDIGFVRYERMKVHDVPYGALLPEKVDGLLAAGRGISATHVAAAAGKSMGNCVATGHAAGIAAAMSAEKGKPPRELNAKEIQEKLKADGVNLFPDRDQSTLKA